MYNKIKLLNSGFLLGFWTLFSIVIIKSKLTENNYIIGKDYSNIKIIIGFIILIMFVLLSLRDE
jgi:hypothetical protein